MKRYLLVLIILLTRNTCFAQNPTWAWAVGTGGTSHEDGRAIATDANGNVYITGSYSGSIVMGSTTLTSAGSTDIFVAKYNSTGVIVWAVSAGGSSSDLGQAIAVDGNGAVYITGSFGSGLISFGTATFPNAGSTDLFIAKYDPSGNFLWAEAKGGIGIDIGTSVATDVTGNVYLTGYFTSSSLVFGTTTLSNVGSQRQIFIVKYSSTGAVLWGTSAGGSSDDYAYAVTSDAGGNCYVTGEYESSSISFGTTTLFGGDLFVVKYDPSGNVIWASGALGDLGGFGITADAIGNVYVTGNFIGSFSFGSVVVTGGSGINGFVCKYNASGSPIWVKSILGTNGVNPKGISADGAGNSYVCGTTFGSSVNFGTNTLTYATATFEKSFLVRYDSSGTDLAAIAPTSSSDLTCSSIALDPLGNAFITGKYYSLANFGSISLNSTNIGSDVYVAKIGPGCTSVPSSPGAIIGTTTPCAGSAHTYSVATVSGATSYTWTLPAGWTGTSTTNSITVTAGATGGNITVAAVNACGTSAVQTLAVTVSPGPSASITAAGSTTFCQGGNVVLNANAGTGLSYQWKLNGNNIAGATNASFTANQAGSHTVVVSNGNCSSASAATTVTVHPLPSPVITQTGNSLNTTSVFSSYQWYLNSTPIAGATNQNYTVSQTGNYYLVVTNTSNCSGQSNSIMVVITGIENLDTSILHIVYPNPVQDALYISKNSVAIGKVSLLNAEGREVYQSHVSEKQLAINMREFPPGVYFLKAGQKAGIIKVFKQ